MNTAKQYKYYLVYMGAVGCHNLYAVCVFNETHICFNDAVQEKEAHSTVPVCIQRTHILKVVMRNLYSVSLLQFSHAGPPFKPQTGPPETRFDTSRDARHTPAHSSQQFICFYPLTGRRYSNFRMTPSSVQDYVL